MVWISCYVWCMLHHMQLRVHRSESEAEAFIASNSSQRLWALVVFDKGPSSAGSGASLSWSTLQWRETWRLTA